MEVVDDRSPVFGELSLESVFTQWHGLGPGADGRYWGTYLAANALSAELTVRVRTDGSVYQHTFRRGVTHAVLQSGGAPNDRGLTIRFRPDSLIFGDVRFDSETIRDRLRQCAFLHSGVRISFTDESDGAHDEFEFADGIRAYVAWLNADRTPIHPDVIVIRGEEAGVRYEVGLQWCEGDDVTVSFANDRRLPEGGTHVYGMRAGVTKAVNSFIRERIHGERVVKGDDARTGLAAVVSVRLADAMFMGAARIQLDNPEVEGIVASGVTQFLREHFKAHPAVADRIVRNAIAARDSRETVSAARNENDPGKRTQ
ncbi:hypothetical protein J8F10_01230 [Gemmata sp. G18]|uniref:DNA topoisomerase (ATP-hydrolyzing) n=1 Tax=Gemmata palustris TaxID=2822762 RepID=A0ABS5BJQ6_9BACT|nr:hypothetical protein [Gemmata palustris]MBP3953924.1 hypothetical protein [Gemmata palustris]